MLVATGTACCLLTLSAFILLVYPVLGRVVEQLDKLGQVLDAVSNTILIGGAILFNL